MLNQYSDSTVWSNEADTLISLSRQQDNHELPGKFYGSFEQNGKYFTVLGFATGDAEFASSDDSDTEAIPSSTDSKEALAAALQGLGFDASEVMKLRKHLSHWEKNINPDDYERRSLSPSMIVLYEQYKDQDTVACKAKEAYLDRIGTTGNGKLNAEEHIQLLDLAIDWFREALE